MTEVVMTQSLAGRTALRSTTPSPSVRDGEARVLEGTLDETVTAIEGCGDRAVAIPADLEDRHQRDSLIDKVADAGDGIDILVNNAGFADYSPIESMSTTTFDRTVEHYLTVGPSTAIMTPGAAALLPEGYETEPVEYLAQTVLEMVTLPAAERTGLLAFSLHFPYASETPVMTLDGRSELPRREPPAWTNPNIKPEVL